MNTLTQNAAGLFFAFYHQHGTGLLLIQDQVPSGFVVRQNFQQFQRYAVPLCFRQELRRRVNGGQAASGELKPEGEGL